MQMAFRLRPEYEGLVGATIKHPLDGSVFDISHKLDEGGGTFKVTNSMLANKLRSLRGSRGAILQAFRVPENPEEDWIPLDVAATSTGTNPQTVPEAPTRESEHKAALSQLRQGWSETMTASELRGVLDSREVSLPKHATRADLINALKESDQKVPDPNGNTNDDDPDAGEEVQQ